MGDALVLTPGPEPDHRKKSLEVAAEAAAEFIAASKADATRRAYASDWRDFTTWCAAHQQADLPAAPATVAAYLGALASGGAKVSTVRRRCAAIGDAHQRGGHDNPAAHPGVKATLAGIARTLGAPPVKKAALTADLVATALRRIPQDLAGLRDRALILIGFAAALRRSNSSRSTLPTWPAIRRSGRHHQAFEDRPSRRRLHQGNPARPQAACGAGA